MKKLIILFAVLAMAVPALAQNNAFLTGKTLPLVVGKTSLADTVIALGTFDMAQYDSLQVAVSASDSMAFCLLAQVVSKEKTTDTASIPGNGLLLGQQLTAAGIVPFGWHNFVAIVKPYHIAAVAIKLSIRIKLVGTETYNTAVSSGDKYTVLVKAFGRRS